MMATIGLSMIVRNEAKLIRRCLESVRSLVDLICISDTGSTDETQNIICDFCQERGIAISLTGEPWKDFATNRNIALSQLHGIQKTDGTEIDYAFMIDADDQLVIEPGFDIAAFKAGMDKDVYDVQVEHGGVVHNRPQIFRNKPGYYFVGVLHEYLEVDKKPFTRGLFPGLTIKASIEGSRNADPLKFQKDAELLKSALKTEKSEYLRARYTFYLAQSYRDANEPLEALPYYMARSRMGIWDQEVYISLVEAIRCYIKIENKADFQAAYDCFERAFRLKLNRAEAHHAMAFLCRKMGKNQLGAKIARVALGFTVPGGLFVEPWVYDYGLRDEYAVNAYWAGQYLECLESCLVLLANPKTPRDMVKRLADNGMAAFDKLKPKFVSNTSLVFSD